jgi:hypothetical protein
MPGSPRPRAPARRAVPAAAALALALALAPGCSDDHRGSPGASGAGSGAPPPAAGAQLRGNRAAASDGPAGQTVHRIERRSAEGLARAELAVGGGWVYWIERPRGGGPAAAVVRRKPTAAIAAAPETVTGPAAIRAIAADADRLYVAGDALGARPHAARAPEGLGELAAGAWLEIVPGRTHLLVRSRDRVALVPRGGGGVEPVWEGKHGTLAVAVDGDRFIAIPHSPWAQRSARRAITAFSPGAPPAVIAELADARGDLAVDGDWIYVAAGPTAPAPLWRLPRTGGAAERVGDPAWGFGELLVRRGVLYGMVRTDQWALQRVPLPTAGATRPPAPTVLDAQLAALVPALATDETHLYYLTDFEVRRVPL